MRIVKYIFFTFAISEIIFICSFWNKNFKGLDCAKDRLLQVDRVEITSDRSSTSQIFFKTGYIEYLAIFTRKRLCWDFFLTLIWVGFLGVRFEVQGVGVKLNPPSPPLSKTCQNYARNFKFDTKVHTRMQFQKIYLLVPRHS